MATRIDDGVVQAAGAVVWRRPSPDGPVEVVIVHRPRYDDWTFPKGKLEPGESFEDGARRELEEETGFDVELGEAVADCRYVDHLGRPKLVRFFAATVVTGAFTPNDEVDDLRWHPLATVTEVLSYDRDADVAGAFSRSVGA